MYIETEDGKIVKPKGTPTKGSLKKTIEELQSTADAYLAEANYYQEQREILLVKQQDCLDEINELKKL